MTLLYRWKPKRDGPVCATTIRVLERRRDVLMSYVNGLYR